MGAALASTKWREPVYNPRRLIVLAIRAAGVSLSKHLPSIFYPFERCARKAIHALLQVPVRLREGRTR